MKSNNSESSQNFLQAKDRYLIYLQGGEDKSGRGHSNSYIKEIEAVFTRFINYVRQERDINLLKLDEVSKEMADKFIEYVEQTKKFSARTLNKEASILTSFYTWLG